MKFLELRIAGNPRENCWRKPLAAVASADDPFFPELRRAVAEDHALPNEILPGARSVIVFFLPFLVEVGAGNDRSQTYASREWAEAYVATNRLIGEINDRLKALIEGLGYEAAVTPATHNFDEARLISRWSHKHAAWIAGLGVFGLHRLLITESGCCGRLGSLVTSMLLPPTKRPDREYCLAKAGYECAACVSKCEVGALTENGFDRHACYAQLLRNDAFHDDLPLVDVCGKCGCEVPCSYRIPVAERS